MGLTYMFDCFVCKPVKIKVNDNKVRNRIIIDNIRIVVQTFKTFLMPYSNRNIFALVDIRYAGDATSEQHTY